MAGLKVLYDTNILIDFLRGVSDARPEFDRNQNAALSIVTWMEVMAGANPTNEPNVRGFLQTMQVLPLDAAVAERAVVLRRERGLKLPDAIIYATAEIDDRLLVTRNTRDFASDDPAIRVPYRL